ncbi:acyl-CoA thioesterase, partial [Acinetobacter baumannii]|nr:acyl-CoA thioesterase [Acinetobacter baumannii]
MPTLDEMTTVTDDQSELTMSVLMTPDMANFSGNVHGGTILKLLDQVAYAC